MNVKNPEESSNPKKPVFAVPEKYLNSSPRSLLSSVEGLVPPIAVPNVITGSTIVETVELTVVVVPFTVKFPEMVTLSLISTVPLLESKIKLPVEVVTVLSTKSICTDPKVAPAAANKPSASLNTMVEAVFVGVAFETTVKAVPSPAAPIVERPLPEVATLAA